jgi:hypothetical protein
MSVCAWDSAAIVSTSKREMDCSPYTRSAHILVISPLQRLCADASSEMIMLNVLVDPWHRLLLFDGNQYT